MVWVQVIFFIITNAPSLIKAIKDLMEIFDGDKAVAKAVLSEMRDVKRYTPKDGTKRSEAMKSVIDRYANRARS